MAIADRARFRFPSATEPGVELARHDQPGFRRRSLSAWAHEAGARSSSATLQQSAFRHMDVDVQGARCRDFRRDLAHNCVRTRAGRRRASGGSGAGAALRPWKAVPHRRAHVIQLGAVRQEPRGGEVLLRKSSRPEPSADGRSAVGFRLVDDRLPGRRSAFARSRAYEQRARIAYTRREEGMIGYGKEEARREDTEELAGESRGNRHLLQNVDGSVNPHDSSPRVFDMPGFCRRDREGNERRKRGEEEGRKGYAGLFVSGTMSEPRLSFYVYTVTRGEIDQLVEPAHGAVRCSAMSVIRSVM